MATKKNADRVDYTDAEKIKAYCENDIVECDDWKVRLKQEYVELKERYEKLKKYNYKQKIKKVFADPGVYRWSKEYAESRKESHRNDLLINQEEVMSSYLRILEERMTLEGVEW